MDMNIIMNDSHIVSMWQVEESVKTAVVPTFSFDSHQQAHAWVSEVLDRFRYFDKQRTKKEKVLIRAYITRYAAYSVSQLTRLVKEKKETGTLKYGKGKKKHQFKKIYTPEDARMLALADNANRRISENAIRAVFQKLLIEQTKSRSGRCNDNALIESKNGSVIRKHMGHWHIPKYEARKINGFYRDCFNEFLCFHRMCAYPTTIVLDNGKKKKVYEDIMTPVQKLLSI